MSWLNVFMAGKIRPVRPVDQNVSGRDDSLDRVGLSSPSSSSSREKAKVISNETLPETEQHIPVTPLRASGVYAARGEFCTLSYLERWGAVISLDETGRDFTADLSGMPPADQEGAERVVSSPAARNNILRSLVERKQNGQAPATPFTALDTAEADTVEAARKHWHDTCPGYFMACPECSDYNPASLDFCGRFKREGGVCNDQ